MDFLEELKTLKEQVLFRERFTIDPEEYDNIVISGMGGSGIVGNIFSELYTKKPVIVVSDYDIPEFANDKTLFIGISYSGNTEETLSTLKQAEEAGCHIVGITSGGKLSQANHRIIKIPKGLQPRSSLGYMLMPLINSLLPVSDEERISTSQLLAKIDSDNAQLKTLAEEIGSKQQIPVVLGFSPFKWVAYRWKTQFNENSKILAFSNFFPELNHNETMPYKGTYRKDIFRFIVIGNPDNVRIKKRIEITGNITGTGFTYLPDEGQSTFEKLFALIHKGDYLTYHLAHYLNVDPTDVSLIEELKKKLGS